MAPTEAQRLEIYELVKQSSMGKEGAELVMEAVPNVDWTSLATHDDLGLLRSELRGEVAELRGELREFRWEILSELSAMESRLQRSMVTWILAAQGVTLAAISALIALVAFLVA